MALTKTNKNIINSGATSLDSYNDYVNQIEMNKLNSRAELASSQEKSNALMNNYLKALGVAGSGLGQSAIAQNNLNYGKIMNDTDYAYNQDLDTYKQNTVRNLNSMASDIASLDDKKAYQNFTNNIGDFTGYKDYYDVIANSLTDKDEEGKNTALESINEMISSNPKDTSLKNLKNIIYSNDPTSEEYKTAIVILDKMQSGIELTDEEKDIASNGLFGRIKEVQNTARKIGKGVEDYIDSRFKQGKTTKRFYVIGQGNKDLNYDQYLDYRRRGLIKE